MAASGLGGGTGRALRRVEFCRRSGAFLSSTPSPLPDRFPPRSCSLVCPEMRPMPGGLSVFPVLSLFAGFFT